MDRMAAFCGLVCTEYPAYIATQAGEPGAWPETLAAGSWWGDDVLSATQMRLWCTGRGASPDTQGIGVRAGLGPSAARNRGKPLKCTGGRIPV